MSRREAETIIRAVLRRIRRQAARTSVQHIRRYEAAVRALAQEIPAGASGTITPARARELTRRLHAVLGQVEAALTQSTQGSITLISHEIRDEYKTVHARLYRAVGLPSGGVTVKFDAVPRRIAQRLVTVGGRRQTLEGIVTRNLDAAREDVERYIHAATGKQPSSVAVRSVLRLLDGKLPVDLGELGLEPPDVSAAKGLLPRGRRIIATESFHAMREGTAEASERSPVIMVARWTLSDRHADLPSSPDACDDLANGGRTIDGEPGWYRPQDWPAAPHPWCACYQGDIRVIDPDEWPTG